MTNTDRATYTLDDALTAISDFALALRSDSHATDSSLDDLFFDLSLMTDHAQFDDIMPDDDDPIDYRLDPDFDDPSRIAALAIITTQLFMLRD